MQTIDKHQRDITKICVRTALLLLQYGTESALIVQLTKRLGIALGMEKVECAIAPNSIILTTIIDGKCMTTVRNNPGMMINMHVVTEVQHVVILTEQHLYNWEMVRDQLDKIHPEHYNRYLVILMVGLSCAAFAHLAGGDWTISLVTFFASAIGMFVRQTIASRHFNHIIVFSITAFITSLIAGIALKFNLGNDPQIAMASSVLLLVPGFPLVNSFSDILKGYVSMGIGRWCVATILTFGACMGIVMALSLLNVSNWGV